MDSNSSTIVRYSDDELEEFRAIIEKKLAKSQEELGYLQEQILEITENSGDDHGGDWMDDSSTNNDMEFLNNMAIRQRKYIQDLQNALVRIKNKSYGICVITGDLIDKKRLLAVPTASKSIAAKNAQAIPQKPPKRSSIAPLRKKKKPTPPKVITKVIKKSSAVPPKPVDLDDDDDDDDLDLDMDKDYGYDADDEISGIDLEEQGGSVEQPDMFDEDDD